MLIGSARWPMWVIVAGGGAADVYRLSKPSSGLIRIDTIANDRADLRERDELSDRPGRSFDSIGSGRHSMEPPTPRKRTRESRYVADISARLARGNNDQLFGELAIIAAPRMLGAIRASLPGPLRSKVGLEIPKDLSHSNEGQISHEIDAYLRPDN